MAVQAEERKAEVLAGIESQLQSRLPPTDAALAERFAHAFYRDVAPVDLTERDPQDLYGAALAMFRFGQEREPGTIRLRAYSPRLDQHGWQSTHTIIEIVNDDMPFLVDSVGMELSRLGLGVHLVIHPVLGVRREADGRLVEVGLPAKVVDGTRESFMHVEIDRQSDPDVLGRIETALARVLGDVRAAVGDWKAMRAQLEAASREIEPAGGQVAPENLAEAASFLRWLADDHFTLLGYVTCALEDEAADGPQLRHLAGTGLGIMRGKGEGERSASFAELPASARARALQPEPAVLVAKANARSTVHRASYLDFVGVKRFEGGRVVGEHRFLGLFTSTAYSVPPASIPLLRHKIERILERAGFTSAGHANKALAHILETYPRDELFQTSEDELFPIVTGILHLQDRQRLKLFVRPDPFGRSASCLVFVPRDRYNTALRERMQRLLVEATGATDCEFQAQLTESSLARLLFLLHTPKGLPADFDAAELERRLLQLSQGWADRLRAALLETRGEEDANRLLAAYGRSMPVSYQEAVEPRLAVPDILELDRLARASQGDLSLSLYRRLEDPAELLHLKLIRRGGPVPLSDVLPLLENMGLKVLGEQPHEIRGSGGEVFHLHDFSLRPLSEARIDVEAVREPFVDAFLRLWTGRVENDGFNRLVLTTGLAVREVAVLRAYCKYLLQTGTPFSQAYVEQTLTSNPELARALSSLFLARFDPKAEDRAARTGALEAEINLGLDSVQSLDEDRILRRYLGLIQATLRTTYFQQGADGAEKPYLALKFDSGRVPELPLPKPLYEIFVYAPAVEAIHLRGGKVARGGIRWSDRKEDFRTEVLGLMKAQMVKNSVIVPVGAKGGFVLKRPPAGGDRAALQEEAVRCYRLFLSGLLDITDNRKGEAIVPPKDVVRYDDDDPYLVVAADKGTATFSDYANELSVAYGFWLGDAFASGGSAGYDHKKMGITARGAWESVKRHFRELGQDPAQDSLSVIGIGDMSGDVFGNGMLLSDKLKLVAAFDHRHIFIDPDPDPAVSFGERQRLFNLPRSSWADYDAGKISPGGAIFPRTLKRLSLSAQAQAVLGLTSADLTPLELLSGILKAPVDLFWNGGIGTYVKAASESHADAQDRSNDPIRVDAEDLRCKVVGEGGNLGFTQRGRIAYALTGGRINTDFIDNSAGVDCSDHEVNIKILTEAVLQAGDLTRKQRDELLAGMTDEVAELILRDNVLQNLALSMSEAMGVDLLDAQIRLMRKLERQGRLNRKVELLPTDAVLNERRQAGKRLTRPEIAVLLAYAKMTLYADLLATDLPDRPYLALEIGKYFPRELRRRFGPGIERHGLRREIVATWTANSIVNRGLEVFVSELEDETGCDLVEITVGYVIARDAFLLLPLWSAVEDLPRETAGDVQIRLLLAIREVLARGTRWFLAHARRPLRIGEEVERFQPAIREITAALEGVLTPGQGQALAATVAAYAEAGVPAGLARELASLPHLLATCDIVAVAGSAEGASLLGVAKVHFALADLLDLAWLAAAIERAPRRSGWDRLALTQLSDQLAGSLRTLVRAAITAGVGGTGDALALHAWQQAQLHGLDRYRGVLAELKAAPVADLAMLSVAVGTLDGLLRGR